ncbi:hypothetical protein D1007_61850 [Hordeum vulgare]|uniref:Predicted protein n=1 Tax=Hordeum vulgare subsp. vulgare TaxID=112509 RepID=F2DGC9_HORVV|nr:uncharacterized protein LOC123447005 [Hordeum vulgare subsp. vulgare]KAE8766862.1 hypothetical protein D1007_61850 [Hordeum vulgare]KAI4998719.1 hypothetical protein ZWY2020_054061 [Hordeum vulgare]BAJ94150.1 predicted protein [Hordeum vulgare subsp. vulgare]BAJ96559.1 predicted protein [Hordeum vulgare subsp. vulgare]BAK01392.1 predicted protein [Hordeum vulgare subsp. vulgare]
MQRLSQVALRRLLSPPSAASAARRAAPVAAEAACSGGAIPVLRRAGGAKVAAGGWSGGSGVLLCRRLCTYNERDDRALEEEVEKKFGWILKIFFIGTAGLVGWQFFPYMGDNLLQQSITLLHVKDPLFKRMGASRLARFAVDDERRMKVVEMGGAQEILNVLEGAKDDKTRKEALKALVALAKSDKAAGFLDKAGAYAIVASTPDSPEYAEIEACKASLLKTFDQLKS